MSDLGGMTTCPHCGEEITTDAKTCLYCGESVEPSAVGGSNVNSFSFAMDEPADLEDTVGGEGAGTPFSVFDDEPDPSDSPTHFEELGQTDPSTGAEEQGRQKKMMSLGAVALTVLALAIMGVGGWLLVSSRLGGAEPEPTPTMLPPTVVPTQTPLPVAQATIAPAVEPVVVQIDGPAGFPQASYPYKALYNVRLDSGGPLTATLHCDGCLKADEAQFMRRVESGSAANFQLVVPPLQEVNLALYVAGEECQSWKLSPAGEESMLAITCEPQVAQ